MATPTTSGRPLRPFRNKDATLRRILTHTRTIALVGASDKEDRPSHEVMKFLLDHGYNVIPINPRLQGQELMGQTVLASLDELPQVLLQRPMLPRHPSSATSINDNDDDNRNNQESIAVQNDGGIMVDIFRRSDSVGEIVDQAIALGPGLVSSIWMQIGVVDQEAARRAMDAGLDVAMNTCPVEEIPRLGIRHLPVTTRKQRGRVPVDERKRKRIVISSHDQESTKPSPSSKRGSRGKRRN